MNTTTSLALRALSIVSLCASLGACGSGHDSSTAGTTPSTTGSPPAITTYSVGGTVSGLVSGTQLKLLNNGGDTLTVNRSEERRGGMEFSRVLFRSPQPERLRR